CAAVALIALTWLFLEWRQWFAGVAAIRWAMLIGALVLGWRLPDLILARLAARRRLRIEQGMPDALDLLVISAEAGLRLDQALEAPRADRRTCSTSAGSSDDPVTGLHHAGSADRHRHRADAPHLRLPEQLQAWGSPMITPPLGGWRRNRARPRSAMMASAVSR